MKKLNQIHINPDRMIKGQDLLQIRGGGVLAGCLDACSDNDDCTNKDCPSCSYPAGNPDQKFCFNP